MPDTLAVQNTPLASIDSWQRSATAPEIAAQVQLIQQVLEAVMIEGVHYGTIPGTDKPSLFKAGSEKILMTFRLGVDPRVEDLSTQDCFRYRVLARIIHQPSGLYLGSGVGECSSDETKYKWRAAVCEAEYDETPADRRRALWKRDRDGEAFQVQQVRASAADVANTVLKIAKKRAQIDGTLTVTAASDVFSQDLEDLEEADVEKGNGGERGPKDEVTAKVVNISEKSGTKSNGDEWKKLIFKLSDGKTYSTFHRNLADQFPKGSEVTIKFKQSQYGRDIVDMRAAGTPPAEKTAEKKAEPTGDKVFVSDVYAAGKDRGWDTKKTGAFVLETFKKEITALERGAECAAAIKAIREHKTEEA